MRILGRRANAIQVFVVCTVSLWFFLPPEPIGIYRVGAEEYEPPTFVAWPEKSLGLSIDLAGFKKDLDHVKPDGRRHLMASHPTTGLNVSVTLEIVPTQASTQGCIDQLKLIQKGPLATRAQDVKLDTAGKIPTLEYVLHEFEGIRVDQKNVYACLAQKDVYADIHLSKVQFTTADAPLFQTILKSVRLQSGPSEVKQIQAKPQPQTQPQPQIQTPPPEPPNSRELFNLGKALYVKNKYALAVLPYQKAFDLEKANPELDRTLWRMLIDNLGTAYSMTGRLKEARATFEQGIQADPTYPIFHYSLACTFAEMNDLDRTMQSLSTAFRHRKNLNPGEKTMPDPRQDSPFQRFMKNETFRNFVNDLAATKS
ncbi:MAG: tetratricopeptide repeat protein [Nitrospira sp.]|nr:tetratricopeptide repeat protein [Nitrospira sp.]TKB72504.1 MAG: tetratricopeptide repeat protein [Nitrospira sp.]